jgi:nitrogen fixation protein FixH
MRLEEEKNDKQSKIPYFFLAFFAVVIAVNLFYIYLSNVSWRGVIMPDSYKRGLEYNETLKQAEEQKKLGWSLEIQLNPIGEGEFYAYVIPRNKNLAQINDADVRIEFKRPTQEGYDFITKFEFKDGVYKARIKLPAQGQWDLGAAVAKDSQVYREVKRLVIKW